MKPTREECAEWANEFADFCDLKDGPDGHTWDRSAWHVDASNARLVAAYLGEPGAEELAEALARLRKCSGPIAERYYDEWMAADKQARALLARRDAREGGKHGEG